MREVSLSKFGLLTVEDAAKRRGVAARTVQRWIESGAIACVPVGPPGRNRKFVVIAEEVDSYQPAPPGRQSEEEKPTEKKPKGRAKKK